VLARLNGLRGLKEDELQSMKVRDTGDCQQAETLARKLIRTNRRLTVREISAEVGISYDMCQVILTEDLNMRRVSAKFVPRVITIEQKEHRVSVATISL
jgi:histone-lysine N-methyltransferase SETMAR